MVYHEARNKSSLCMSGIEDMAKVKGSNRPPPMCLASLVLIRNLTQSLSWLPNLPLHGPGHARPALLSRAKTHYGHTTIRGKSVAHLPRTG